MKNFSTMPISELFNLEIDPKTNQTSYLKQLSLTSLDHMQTVLQDTGLGGSQAYKELTQYYCGRRRGPISKNLEEKDSTEDLYIESIFSACRDKSVFLDILQISRLLLSILLIFDLTAIIAAASLSCIASVLITFMIATFLVLFICINSCAVSDERETIREELFKGGFIFFAQQEENSDKKQDFNENSSNNNQIEMQERNLENKI